MGRNPPAPGPRPFDLFAGYHSAPQRLTLLCGPTDRQSGFSSTHHRPVHVPERSLLAVKNLPLYLVSLLVHSVNITRYLKEMVLTTVILNTASVQSLVSPLPPFKQQTNPKLLFFKGTYFACASACIKINSHFRANARCSLAKLS